MEFLKLLLFTDQNAEMQLIDGSDNYKTVEINVLKNKKALLVVSRLDISDAEINIFRRIQFEKIKREKIEDQYVIVWVPIVDEKRPEFKQLKKDFENWLRSMDMQWYTLRSPVSHTASVKFLKEEWHFKSNTPAAMVMNGAEGKVENLNAFHTIRLWGLEAFPFDKEAEQRISEEMNCIQTFLKDFPLQCTKLANWVRRRSGLGRLKKNLNFISKESSTTIKQFDIEEKGSEVKERFWNGVDSLYFTKLHKQHESFWKQQIERLCSYKKAEGWFTLNKGATTVIVGNRATFSKVFGEFHKWKESARLKSFEVAFKEYHEKIVADHYSLVAVDSSIIRKQNGCCIIFEAPIGGGKLPPEAIKCPMCGQIMEIASYKYGHNSKG